MDHDFARLRAADPASGEHHDDNALGAAARRYALTEVRPRRRGRLLAGGLIAAALVIAPGVAVASGALSFGSWEGGAPLATSESVTGTDGQTCGVGLWMTPVDTIGTDTDADGYFDEWRVAAWSVDDGPLVGLTDVGDETTPPMNVSISIGPADEDLQVPTTFAQADYDAFDAWAQAQDWNSAAADILRDHAGDGSAAGRLLEQVQAEATAAGYTQNLTAALMSAETCTDRG